MQKNSNYKVLYLIESIYNSDILFLFILDDMKNFVFEK